MKMAVLRAVKELEYGCDIDVTTEVPNIECDSEGFVTIYGTEKNGQLYYVVLDPTVVDKIKTVQPEGSRT